MSTAMILSMMLLLWLCTARAHYPDRDPHRHPTRGYPTTDYQNDDSDRMTFDGIYERRKNFDADHHNMEVATEASAEADGHQYDSPPVHSGNSGHTDDDMQSSDANDANHNHKPNGNGNGSPSDDYASESIAESNSKSLLSDGCLRCLCEASSDCDPQVRCHVDGPDRYNCGPFQINANYWSDAGSPGADQNDPLDFEECMNEIECAIDTVNGYMQKNGRDCNGDGRVSCDDFARIHKAGPHQCNSSWVDSTPFWNKYKDCYFEYR